MKKLLAGAILCGAMMCTSAHADEASKRAKIGELFAVMHMQQAMDQMATQQQKQVKDMLPGMFPDAHFTADQQKDLDALLDRVSAITREELDWKKLQPQFTDLYASTYDEATVDGILSFYRSPAGMTMIAKQSELITKSQGITQQKMVDMQPKLREAFQEFLVKVQKSQPAPSMK